MSYHSKQHASMTFYKHKDSKAVSKPKVDLTIVRQQMLFSKKYFVEVFAAISIKLCREWCNASADQLESRAPQQIHH